MDEKVEMSLDSFMDLMEDKKESDRAFDELNTLLDLIFNSVRLRFDDKLTIDDCDELMTYLKIEESYRYENKQKELIKQRETEEK